MTSKKVICELIGVIPWLDTYTNISIEKAIDNLKDLKATAEKDGYRNIRIKVDSGNCYECSSTEVTLWADRDETDREYSNRLKREKKTREKNKIKAEEEKNKRYKDYLKLKKEFG